MTCNLKHISFPKHIALIFAVLAVLPLTQLAQTSSFVGGGNAEQEVRTLFTSTANAVERNDFAAFAKHFSDDVTFTGSDGKTIDKSELLRQMKAVKWVSFIFSDLNVRVFGDVAVVNFTRTSTNVDQSGSNFGARSRDTATVVKNGKGWQIVAIQISKNMADQSAYSERTVRKTLDELYAAPRANDAEALDRIYADDYTLINESGVLTPKGPRLAAIRSGEMKYESISFDAPAIRVHGDTAVATYRVTLKANSKGQEIGGPLYVTATFVKTKERWRLLAAQATTIKE